MNKFEEFKEKILTNKIIVWVIIIFIIITSFAYFIQSTGYLWNLVSDLFRSKIESTRQVDKPFLVFEDSSYFLKWHIDVKFKLGLPKFSREVINKKINDSLRVYNYSDMISNFDPKDKRVMCIANKEEVPNEFFDSLAEAKYKFIKVSYQEAEEMGFIKDDPAEDRLILKIINYDFVNTHTQNFINVRDFMYRPDIWIEGDLKLKENFEYRNKYIIDIGDSSKNLLSNRISIYLDQNNNFCFRVIGRDSVISGIKFKIRVPTDYFHFHCNFGFNNIDTAYMAIYINNNIVAQETFVNRFKMDFIHQFFTVGANLKGFYALGASFREMYVYKDYLDRKKYLLHYNQKDSVYTVAGKSIKMGDLEQNNLGRAPSFVIEKK